MAIAVRIDCMECTGDAFLQQPPAEDDVIEPGDVMVYRCRDCGQRWDVVVDEADLVEDD